MEAIHSLLMTSFASQTPRPHDQCLRSEFNLLPQQGGTKLPGHIGQRHQCGF